MHGAIRARCGGRNKNAAYPGDESSSIHFPMGKEDGLAWLFIFREQALKLGVIVQGN